MIFAQIYLRKEVEIFWASVFILRKLCELSKERKSSIFVSAIEIAQLWQNLTAFIVPYIHLSQKHCE